MLKEAAGHSVWNNRGESVFEKEPKWERTDYYWDAIDIRRAHAFRHQTAAFSKVKALIAPSQNGLRMAMRVMETIPFVQTSIISNSTMRVEMFENIDLDCPEGDSAILSWGAQKKNGVSVTWRPTQRMQNMMRSIDTSCADFLRDGTKLLVVSLLMATFEKNTMSYVRSMSQTVETANGLRFACIPNLQLSEWEELAMLSAKKRAWKSPPGKTE